MKCSASAKPACIRCWCSTALLHSSMVASVRRQNLHKYVPRKPPRHMCRRLLPAAGRTAVRHGRRKVPRRQPGGAQLQQSRSRVRTPKAGNPCRCSVPASTPSALAQTQLHRRAPSQNKLAILRSARIGTSKTSAHTSHHEPQVASANRPMPAPSRRRPRQRRRPTTRGFQRRRRSPPHRTTTVLAAKALPLQHGESVWPKAPFPKAPPTRGSRPARPRRLCADRKRRGGESPGSCCSKRHDGRPADRFGRRRSSSA
mmetsp:Transcript_13758/g.37244  ORF Transcript_13758/g.37244 Transcript_13758/m.37244 type:complete len:257 (+) Transcript_13758:325-1095(+)